MSSHAKPCYNLLSQYTQNGLQKIIVPTPVETRPGIFNSFTPHPFSQTEYEDLKELDRIRNGDVKYNCGYSVYADTGCGRSTNEKYPEYTFHYNYNQGFNEVGFRRY